MAIGSKGELLDLVVRQGGTLYFTLALSVNGTPINLTGYTVRSQIRKTPDSPTISATAVITIISAVNGQVGVKFTAVQTALMTASNVDETQPESQYVWDLEMEDASLNVTPLIYGNVAVFREVTKP